jgi:hypothetical protein
MATDAPARPPGRPRPWLLVALAVTVVVATAVQLWPSGPAAPAAARAATPGAATQRPGVIDPSDLVVHLEALDEPRPKADGPERNPFRFQPKPPPPPPPGLARPAPLVTAPPVPSGPPPPPPIPLKFIGTVEPTPGDQVAALSDCRYTFRGREGDIIDGRYRLVKIGVESVIMEYLDGRGRTTIRLNGQECVGK